jgi:hypothetical protein
MRPAILLPLRSQVNIKRLDTSKKPLAFGRILAQTAKIACQVKSEIDLG